MNPEQGIMNIEVRGMPISSFIIPCSLFDIQHG